MDLQWEMEQNYDRSDSFSFFDPSFEQKLADPSSNQEAFEFSTLIASPKASNLSGDPYIIFCGKYFGKEEHHLRDQGFNHTKALVTSKSQENTTKTKKAPKGAPVKQQRGIVAYRRCAMMRISKDVLLGFGGRTSAPTRIQMSDMKERQRRKTIDEPTSSVPDVKARSPMTLSVRAYVSIVLNRVTPSCLLMSAVYES